MVHAQNHAVAVISPDLGNVTIPLQFRAEVLVQDLQRKRGNAMRMSRVQVFKIIPDSNPPLHLLVFD